jgi:hypothetical protein
VRIFVLADGLPGEPTRKELLNPTAQQLGANTDAIARSEVRAVYSE